MRHARIPWVILIAAGVLAIVGILAVYEGVRADTSSTSATVNATVPGTSVSVGPTGGGPGVDSIPPSITNVATTTAQTSTTIQWNAADNSGVAPTCGLDIGLATSTEYTTTYNPIVTDFLYRVTITALSPDTGYNFRIVCSDAAANPNVGIFLGNFRTLAFDTAAPVITDVITGIAANAATVTWTATDNTSVRECTFVYDRDNATPPFLFTGSVNTTTVPNQYRTNVVNLVSNITYFGRITCVDSMNNQAATSTTWQTPPDVVPPPDVENFRAFPRSAGSFISWTYPTTFPDIAGFEIRRAVGSRPTTLAEGTLVTRITDTTMRSSTDTGLTNGVEYFYTIFVLDTSSNSSNGVSASAIPTASGDRDGDGVSDDNDFCDSDVVTQVDTPPGTVVDAANGCPLVTFDSSGLSISVLRLIGPAGVQRRSDNRIAPREIFRSTTPEGVIRAGLPAGSWSTGEAYEAAPRFIVAPDGRLSWVPALNAVFSATYDAGGARLLVRGYTFTIDTTNVDPKNNLFMAGFYSGAAYLRTDRTLVTLMPSQYFLNFFLVANITVQSNGAVTWWTPHFNDLFAWRDNTLTISGIPVCLEQSTLEGAYRFVSLHGTTPYVTGTSTYRILPIYPLTIYDRPPALFNGNANVWPGRFNPIASYIQAQRFPNERRNLIGRFEPTRLIDAWDSEVGPRVNLSIGVQNLAASVGVCPQIQPNRCGDRARDFAEQCDDGNRVSQDGCSASCTIEAISRCGNRIVEGGEACDDGPTCADARPCATANDCIGAGDGSCRLRGGDGCSELCRRDEPVCGDRIVQPARGEECDDGNTDDTDDCTAQCRRRVRAVCGNTVVETGEQCDDGNIRDADGCSGQCRVETSQRACNDGRDNDSDGRVDLADPGCAGPDDTSEYNAPVLPVIPRTTITDFGTMFWIGRRSIPVIPVNGVVTTLTDDQLSIAIPWTTVTTSVDRIDLILLDNRYTLSRDTVARWYRVDVVVPPPGRYEAIIEEYSQAGLSRTVRFTVESLPYGVVRDAKTGGPISDARIALLDGTGALWPGGQYGGQTNPVVTRPDGLYGFVVPNGEYTVLIERDDFESSRLRLVVDRHVTAESISLRPIVPTLPLLGDIFSSSTLSTIQTYLDRVHPFFLNVKNSLVAVKNTVVTVLQDLQQLADDPEVERIAEQIVAPSATGFVAVAVVPSLSNIFLPLLRYIFLQPLLLVGKKKRKEWGMVYNSLSKLPVDLAMVRLIDRKTNRVVQSRVTDFQGRYIFFAPPGVYVVQVQKPGFVFPSRVLQSVTADGQLVDLYHGKEMTIAGDAQPIAANIPLDPVGVERTPRRIVWKQRLRIAQHVISLAGIATTAISFAIIPKPMTGVYLVLHLLVYAFFLRFVKPKHPKRWGTISDAATHHPIGRAVVRLFTVEYNKLVAMQVADTRGRYAFLVGPSRYYVAAERSGYITGKTPVVHIEHEEKSFVKEDVRLKKDIVSTGTPTGGKKDS